jgi:hypothetical protein
LGVEGKHDISFLKRISQLLSASGLNVPNLDALEIDDKVIFFPLGGSNLALWSSRLQALNCPEYHICDRDIPPPDPPKYHTYMADVNARSGCKAVCTSRRELENYLHPDAIREAYAKQNIALNLPASFSDFDDVPDLVAQAVHAAGGGASWATLDKSTQDKKRSKAKSHLNGGAVSQMTVARLAATDPNGEIIGWLTDMQALLI